LKRIVNAAHVIRQLNNNVTCKKLGSLERKKYKSFLEKNSK